MDKDFMEFANAKDQYRKGDPRPLAEYVRANPLGHPEQREFVADALAGDIPIIDGRKIIQSTEALLGFYDEAKRRGYSGREINQAIDATQGQSATAYKKTIYRHRKTPSTD